MNIPLLRKIQKAIREEPRRFDMRDWVMLSDKSPCGTSACIAGHAAMIALKKPPEKSLALAAGRLLDKHNNDNDYYIAQIAKDLLLLSSGQANRLFFRSEWPAKFQKLTKTPKARAQQAIARINHFIKTKGKE